MDDSTLHSFKRELDALATVRDELKLKAHLARAEARTQLDELEKKWGLAQERYEQAKSHAQRDVTLLQSEFQTLVGDLKKGFQSVKRSFEES